jgi:hypothetical protein
MVVMEARSTLLLLGVIMALAGAVVAQPSPPPSPTAFNAASWNFIDVMSVEEAVEQATEPSSVLPSLARKKALSTVSARPKGIYLLVIYANGVIEQSAMPGIVARMHAMHLHRIPPMAQLPVCHCVWYYSCQHNCPCDPGAGASGRAGGHV